MESRFHFLLVRAALTVAVGVGMSVPCAAQYGVSFGPTAPAGLQITAETQQLMAQFDEIQRLLSEKCRKMQSDPEVVLSPQALEFKARVCMRLKEQPSLQGLKLKASSAQRILSCPSERLDGMLARGQALLSLGQFNMTAASQLPAYTVRQAQESLAQQIGQPHPCRSR